MTDEELGRSTVYKYIHSACIMTMCVSPFKLACVYGLIIRLKSREKERALRCKPEMIPEEDPSNNPANSMGSLCAGRLSCHNP